MLLRQSRKQSIGNSWMMHANGGMIDGNGGAGGAHWGNGNQQQIAGNHGAVAHGATVGHMQTTNQHPLQQNYPTSVSVSGGNGQNGAVLLNQTPTNYGADVIPGHPADPADPRHPGRPEIFGWYMMQKRFHDLCQIVSPLSLMIIRTSLILVIHRLVVHSPSLMSLMNLWMAKF